MPNTVTVEVKADTKKAEGNISKFGSKVKGAMPAVTAVSGGLTLAAGAAVKLGDEMTLASRTISAGTGATGTELESLTESFQNVFKDVPEDSQAVANAIADLNTEFGLTGTELETAAIQLLNAQRAMGGMDIQTVTDSMAVFNLESNQLSTVMDSMAAAAQATGVPISALASKVETFGPVLKNAGFSIDETTALFGSLEANGIAVTRVMPGINASMRRLSEQGVQDLKGAFLGQIEAIKGAESESQALNMATKAFGAEGAQRMTVAIRNGNLELDSLLETMAGSEGTVNNLAESTQTTADKFNIMKNNVKSNLAPVGEFAGAIGPLVMIIPALTTGISGISTAMGLLNLSMGPVLIAVLAITAAIAAAILIWKNWDEIVGFFKSTWDKVWDKIEEPVKTAFDLIKGYINIWIDGINIIIGLLNSALSIKVPSWIPGIGGKGMSMQIPEIPRLAKGGIVSSPTIAMLGEAGKEAVIPLSGTNSGLGGINITISGDVYGFDDFEDKVSEAVRDGARRGGFQGILNTA